MGQTFGDLVRRPDNLLVGPSVCRPVGLSVRRWVGRSAGKSLGRTMSRWVIGPLDLNGPLGHCVSRPVNRSVGLFGQPVGRKAHGWVGGWADWSDGGSAAWPAGPPVGRSAGLSVDGWFDRPVVRSGDEWVGKLVEMSLVSLVCWSVNSSVGRYFCRSVGCSMQCHDYAKSRH